MNHPRAVAVIGTGLLGGAIAERLRTTGHRVIAFNRTESKALALQAEGITVASRPEQAIAQAECVILVLADAEAIQSVIMTPACQPAVRGKMVIQMGTIGSDDSLALQREIARLGGEYCEAPVLGSRAEARAGTLFVMVGGTDRQFNEWAPLFRSLGHEPRLVGEVGTAATLKLALNHLIAAEISAFALSLGLVQRAGVSVETFMAILRESALFAPTFDKKLPRLLTRRYQDPNFSTAHMVKDLDLFLHAARGVYLAVTGAEGLRAVFQRAVDRGLQHLDYSSLFEVINPPENYDPH